MSKFLFVLSAVFSQQLNKSHLVSFNLLWSVISYNSEVICFPISEITESNSWNFKTIVICRGNWLSILSFVQCNHLYKLFCFNIQCVLLVLIIWAVKTLCSPSTHRPFNNVDLFMPSLLHSTVNLKLQFTISLSLFPTHYGISYNTPTNFLPPFLITSSTNESYLCHCSHFVEMIINVTPLLLW